AGPGPGGAGPRAAPAHDRGDPRGPGPDRLDGPEPAGDGQALDCRFPHARNPPASTVTSPTLTRRPTGGGRGRPVARTPIRPDSPPGRAGRRARGRRRRGADGAPTLRWRLVTLVVVLGTAFSALIVRLVEVQGVSADRFASIGSSQRVHE